MMADDSRYQVRGFEERISTCDMEISVDGPMIGVLATDRQALVDLLIKVKAQYPDIPHVLDCPHVLEISLPCGGSQKFTQPEDIPFEDLPCPCGNPEHWLIQYGKGDNDGKGKEDQEAKGKALSGTTKAPGNGI